MANIIFLTLFYGFFLLFGRQWDYTISIKPHSLNLSWISMNESPHHTIGYWLNNESRMQV